MRRDNTDRRSWVETDTQERWCVSLPCRFWWQDEEYVGQVLNLSERGAFAITPFVVPKDSRIRLSFWPQEAEEFYLDTLVAHSGEYPYDSDDCPGMGIRFVSTCRSALLQLRQFLRQAVIPPRESS